MRVPLVMRWPGRIVPGTVESRPVRLHDLFPTVLEAARIRGEGPSVDGRSLLGPDPVGRFTVVEYSRAPFLPAVRSALGDLSADELALCSTSFLAVVGAAKDGGIHKWVREQRRQSGVAGESSRSIALYDLLADANESRNLLATGLPDGRLAGLAREFDEAGRHFEKEGRAPTGGR